MSLRVLQPRHGAISKSRVDEARQPVQTRPRGLLLQLTEFDPSRSTFHIGEVTAFAAMVGRNMLATGRFEAPAMRL